MANAQSILHPQGQEGEHYSNTLDAIVAAPALSIRAVLFSLHVEGTDEVKSLIEDRVSDFTAVANLQTMQNLSFTTTTTNSVSSEETSGENQLKRKGTDELKEEPEKKLGFCIHCEEKFGPDDEDDAGYCGYYHPGESTQSQNLTYLSQILTSLAYCCRIVGLGDMELNQYSHAWRGCVPRSLEVGFGIRVRFRHRRVA